MINITNFAVAVAAARNRGLTDSDANRAGILGSLQTNPIFALVIGKQVGSPPPAARTDSTGGGDTASHPVTRGELDSSLAQFDKRIVAIDEQVVQLDERVKKVEAGKLKP